MLIDLRTDTVTQPTAEMRRAIAERGGRRRLSSTAIRPRVGSRNTVAQLLGKERALFFPQRDDGQPVRHPVAGEPGTEIYADQYAHIVELGDGRRGGDLQACRCAPCRSEGPDDGRAVALARLPPRSIRTCRVRRWSASRTRTTAPAGWSRRSPGFAPCTTWRASAAVACTSMARACGTPRLRVGDAAARNSPSGRHGDGLVLQGTRRAGWRGRWSATTRSSSAPTKSQAAGRRDAAERDSRGRRRCMVSSTTSSRLHRGSRARRGFRSRRGPRDCRHASCPRTTNIVMVDLTPGLDAAQTWRGRWRSDGVSFRVWTPTRLRVVLHLDVSEDEARRPAQALLEALDEAWRELGDTPTGRRDRRCPRRSTGCRDGRCRMERPRALATGPTGLAFPVLQVPEGASPPTPSGPRR